MCRKSRSIPSRARGTGHCQLKRWDSAPIREQQELSMCIQARILSTVTAWHTTRGDEGSCGLPDSVPCPRKPTNPYPCFAQRSRYRGRNFWRAGSVAVDAESLRFDRNLAPVARNHYASLRDAKRLPRGFLGIADESVVKFPPAQRSIRFVPAVGQGFGGDGKASFTENITHRRNR